MIENLAEKTMELGEFRKELLVYNKTINNYIKTFQLNWCSKWAIIGELPSYGEIRDYNIISEELIKKLREHSTKLKIYQLDYYKHKTIEEVAQKINIPLEKVIKHINTKIDFFRTIGCSEIPGIKNILEGNTAGPETILQYTSSYQIHKEICDNDKLELLELELDNYNKKHQQKPNDHRRIKITNR